jgi:hypothetical protein
MANIKGDLNVSRTIQVGRRSNQAAQTKNLTTTETLDKNSYYWNNFTSTGAQNVDLPDATTLNLGWDVVVNNMDGTDTLTVRDAAAGTVKTVVAGRAYRITCTSIGSAAGTWHIDYLEEADLLPGLRYAKTFNATSDWTDAGSAYTVTLTQATHLMGVNPMVEVGELNGSDYDRVICDNLKKLANGDITIQVCKVPDARFEGRMIVM